MQNSSDLVTIVAPDGTILYASDSAERIVGYSPAALVGTSLHGLPGRRTTSNAVRACCRTATARPAGPARRVLPAPEPTASPVWLEAVGTNLLTDATIRGIVLNARDVSERKRADRALRESEERYRDLFDNASDLVCMADPDGSLLYVNQAWQQGTGYREDEIGTAAAARPGPPRQPGSTTSGCSSGCSPASGWTTSSWSSCPRAGLPITVEGNLSCTFKDGRPSVVRGIYRDVTERKRVEEQLRRAERMQAAGKLAGGVAHEVNNMMTGVIGFSEFLLRSLDPEDPRRADVEEVIRAGTRAADVTRQLLAFTRQQFLQPAGARDQRRRVSRWRRCCAARWAKTSSSSCGSLPTPGRSGPTGASWSRCSSIWCSTPATP